MQLHMGLVLWLDVPEEMYVLSTRHPEGPVLCREEKEARFVVRSHEERWSHKGTTKSCLVWHLSRCITCSQANFGYEYENTQIEVGKKE